MATQTARDWTVRAATQVFFNLPCLPCPGCPSPPRLRALTNATQDPRNPASQYKVPVVRPPPTCPPGETRPRFFFLGSPTTRALHLKWKYINQGKATVSSHHLSLRQNSFTHVTPHTRPPNFISSIIHATKLTPLDKFSSAGITEA